MAKSAAKRRPLSPKRPTAAKPTAAQSHAAAHPPDEALVHTISYGNTRALIRASVRSKVGFTITLDRCVRGDSLAEEEQLSGSFPAEDLGHLINTVVDCLKWVRRQERRLQQNTNRPH